MTAKTSKKFARQSQAPEQGQEQEQPSVYAISEEARNMTMQLLGNLPLPHPASVTRDQLLQYYSNLTPVQMKVTGAKH